MLFKASITNETAKDLEKLAEQLYIFLSEFVPKKLRYEDQENLQDCVQDTIMYMINRYRNLDPEQQQHLNLERFFYNRANSYTKHWITTKKNSRQHEKDYVGEKIYLGNYKYEESPMETISYRILEKIVESYQFDKQQIEYILSQAEYQLSAIGYESLDNYRAYRNYNTPEKTRNILNIIAFAVVDEYLVKASEDINE